MLSFAHVAKQIKRVLLSKEQSCFRCFQSEFGSIILKAPYAEYHGGHKAYLAGGMFSKYQSGQMYLSNSHLIFVKGGKDQAKRWEIIIPLASVLLGNWGIEEESRRKTVSGGGVAISDGVALGSGAIHDSGKAHHLVVSYIDANGIRQDPRFGISSFGGKAIRQWAVTFYETVVKAKRNSDDSSSSTERLSSQSPGSDVATPSPNEDPVKILKLRFAKGEITKEQFDEMRKLLEE